MDPAQNSCEIPGVQTTPNSPASPLAPAVFLDRDGTLIEDRGYLRSPAEVVFYPATVAALRRLQQHFRLFIVTNQSGVAKGLQTLAEVEQVNAFVGAHLREQGVNIAAVYCCPHQREDNCACIKPKPYFPELAAREHGLDLRRSFAIGDHLHDVELARQVGGTGVYVLTGHGRKHQGELNPEDIAVEGIAEAADWILQHSGLDAKTVS